MPLPPPLARVAALGPAVLGLLLLYFGFLIHGGMEGNRSTLGTVTLVSTFLLGAAHLLVAPSIAKARVWAVFAGGALLLSGTVWSLALLARGTLAGAFGVALGLASVVVLGLALPGCLRLARARRELAAQHPELLFTRGDRRSDLLGLLAAVAVFAVAGGLFAWRSRTPATAAQRFATSAFGQTLDDPLTKYVAAIGRQGRETQAAEARHELMSKAVEKQLGREAFRTLGDVLDTARVYAAGSADDPAAAQAAYWSALNGLDAQLESRGVAGYVGGYSTGAGESRAVWILGYFARERASVKVGDAPPVRVVWGRRLDSLNLTDSAASLDGPSEWALISLDALEEEFLTNELPAMVRGDAAMHLLAGEVTEQGPALELGRKAASIVADEIVRASRLSREDAAAVNEVLAQRAANEQVLVERGLTLRSRQRLRFTASAARSLRRYDDFVITQLLRGDETLADYEEAVASAVELLAADEEASFLPRVADKTADDRTRAIMGGQLLGIARSSTTPRLTLWRAAQQAARGAYGRRAGATVFEALFRELGVADGLEGSGDPFATALLRALEKDPGEVRAAASRAYASLLGHEPPAVVRTPLR